MSEPSSPSALVGDATSPQPVEIIYLDRGRLFSYASQLYDGLTLIRRIISAAERGQIVSTDELETEKETESTSEGEAGLEAGVRLGGKRASLSKVRQMKSSGGDIDFGKTGEFLAEEKSELDNLFLLVERELTESGILKIYDGTSMSGLVKISAPAKLSDGTLITGILENAETISMLPGIDSPEFMALSLLGGDSLAKLIRFALPNDFTFYFNFADSLIAAPLHSPHLTLSPAQLRANFAAGAYKLSMIAFMPEAATDDFDLPGMFAGMDVKAMLGAFGGESDKTVIPIAVYAELG